MIRALLAALLISVACSGAQSGIPPAPGGELLLSAAERQAGWRLLFDGRTIDKWRGFKQTTVPGGWQVVDGAITRVAESADLVSEEEFADFEFAFEWKVPEGGNSGVMFRVTEDQAATYETGPEYQVLDNARHADGKNPLTSAASNHSLHAPPRDLTRPVGQWNQGRLLVNVNHVEHWLNGEKVVEYELGSPSWEALVAASKFKQWPGYGRARMGRLVLQNHGDAVAYRHLKIRILQ